MRVILILLFTSLLNISFAQKNENIFTNIWEIG
jgi:hypothetical protein